MVLVSSTTFTYTVVVYYFYTNANVFNFSHGNGWSVIPNIQFYISNVSGDNIRVGPHKKDWLLTNIFLLLGICCVISVVVSDFELDMFFGFHGIHDFLQHISRPRRIQYYIAVSTEFFGYGASVCSCCIFHVMTRDLIRHIEYTEDAILIRARTRDDFYLCHESLQQYMEKMTASCRLWFAIHSFFFLFLVFAVLYEWFKITTCKPTEEKYLRIF